jgi:hypothetical protein
MKDGDIVSARTYDDPEHDQPPREVTGRLHTRWVKVLRYRQHWVETADGEWVQVDRSTVRPAGKARRGRPGLPPESIGCLARCGRAARTRGLCHACYVAALRLVRTGETTWRRLEEAGRARPRRATPFNRHPADRQ